MHHVHKFPNGYEASVINTGYGSENGLLEVAAFVGSTGESVSTKGWLTHEEARVEVDRIAALPTRTEVA